MFYQIPLNPPLEKGECVRKGLPLRKDGRGGYEGTGFPIKLGMTGELTCPQFSGSMGFMLDMLALVVRLVTE